MEVLPANYLSEDLIICHQGRLLSVPSRINFRRFPWLGVLDHFLLSAAYQRVKPDDIYPGRTADSHTGAVVVLFLEQSDDKRGFYPLDHDKGLEKLQILTNRVHPLSQERILQGYVYAHGDQMLTQLLARQREILRETFAKSRFYISSFPSIGSMPFPDLIALRTT